MKNRRELKNYVALTQSKIIFKISKKLEEVNLRNQRRTNIPKL